MAEDDLRKTFSPKHHALLFAWMSREVVERAGEERGEEVMRKAVKRYGQQRGKRMALRAQANEQDVTLNMFDFLVYGEWEAKDEEAHERVVLETEPNFHVKITKCPWNDAWKEGDLSSFGRFYCLEVDHALIDGFNPKLKLEVNATLPNDQKECDFVYYDAQLSPENMGLLEMCRAEVHDKAVMPWDYHLGHLYKTVGEVVVEELGQKGREAVNAAMKEFAGQFGEETAGIVEGFEEVDFDRLPERIGKN
jgi:hypothetical protein